MQSAFRIAVRYFDRVGGATIYVACALATSYYFHDQSSWVVTKDVLPFLLAACLLWGILATRPRVDQQKAIYFLGCKMATAIRRFREENSSTPEGETPTTSAYLGMKTYHDVSEVMGLLELLDLPLSALDAEMAQSGYSDQYPVLMAIHLGATRQK